MSERAAFFLSPDMRRQACSWRRIAGASAYSAMVASLLALLAACTSVPQPSADGVAAVPRAPSDSEWQALLPPTPLLSAPIARNAFILRDDQQRVIGVPQRVVAQYEDTLADLGRAYGLGYDDMVAANPGVDPWLPGEGTLLLLPTQYLLPDAPRSGLVLNIATRRLFYYPPRRESEPIRVLTYPIGVGRVGWNTPLGRTRIIAKATDPTWHIPASIRREYAEEGVRLPAAIPPGPNNPLGRYSLRLSRSSYLIHGTNKPYGVGMRVSHGCVRLYPENIERLYQMVPIGEIVTIVNQPYMLAWHDGDLYLEAHRPLKDDQLSPAQRIQALLMRAEAESEVMGTLSAQAQLIEVAAAASGVPVRLLREDAEAVVQRARPVRNVLAEARLDEAELVY